jgi:hypothetical protein
MLEKKNEIKKNEKPVRVKFLIKQITYIDMKKKRNSQTNDKSYILTKGEKIKKEQNIEMKTFPIENFAELKSFQNNKQIKLNTYKYPAKGELKGVVYLM